MSHFELIDKQFHDYNNGEIRKDVKSRKGMLQSNPFKNYDTRSDFELLGYLSNFLVQKDFTKEPKLSFYYRFWRFLRYFKWSNKYFKSGGGNIPDYRFYTREIQFHLNRLTSLTYLSSHEIRQLISASLRVYYKDGWDEGTPLKLEDLHRCKNLQEFYTSEFEVDFEFADKLENLRVVDLYRNSASNERGIEKIIYYEKRNVKNLFYLKSCLVLNLQDSFVDNFSNIKQNVLALCVKNSNFEDLEAISKLKNLQYLDISDNKIVSFEGIQNLKDLKVINCCNLEYYGSEQSKMQFFSTLYWFINLELIVMDSKLYEDYKKCLNMIPPEKVIVAQDNCYFSSVKLDTHLIIEHFKIVEQLNNKNTLIDVDFEQIKRIFLKLSTR